MATMNRGFKGGVTPSLGGDILDPNDISACESMLEAYFMQVAGSLGLRAYE